MKEYSLKKSIILNTIYQVLILIIPIVTTPYISRVIGVSGIGIYSYTSSIQFYFSMFIVLGTSSYGVREIARNRDNKLKRSKAFWEIELLTMITGIICLFAWTLLIVFTNQYKIYYLILTMMLFNSIFDISWFYTGMEQLKYSIIKNIFFKILGVILLFIFVKSSDDLWLYILISSLTTLLGTISMWFYLPKFINKVGIKKLQVLSHFKQTLIYFIPTIATSIYTVLDKTLLGFLTNNYRENGFYEQATKIINMSKILTFTSLNIVLESRISYLFKKKEYSEISKKIDTSINYILFIGIGIVFGLWGISNNFVPLFFGNGYDKVKLLLIILAPLIVIIGISNCLGSQYYNPAGFRAKSSKFIIIGSIVNLVLNIILIPRLMSVGACIATIIAELLITSLYLHFCDNYLSVNKILNYSWKKLISGFIMCVVIMLESKLFNINGILLLIIQIISGIFIYSVCLIVFKDSFILSIIKKNFYRFEGKW